MGGDEGRNKISVEERISSSYDLKVVGSCTERRDVRRKDQLETKIIPMYLALGAKLKFLSIRRMKR